MFVREEDLNSDSWDMEFKDPTKYGIAVITHPMNYTRQQLDTEVM